MTSPGETKVPLIERPVPEDWVQVYLAVLALVAFLLVVAGASAEDDARGPSRPVAHAPLSGSGSDPGEVVPPPGPTGLPRGAVRIFDDGRVLVAFSGTAGTGALGVLGEGTPEGIMPRLAKAAQQYAVGGRTVQPVFDLVVTVAHAGPTRSGSYSSDIDRDLVADYVAAARRHGVLLVLDLQPGRTDFLTVAKRWQWALEDRWVGLALDPEWRVGPSGVPGQVAGSVSAEEVNRVSGWLSDLTTLRKLPEKLLVLHQATAGSVRGAPSVLARPNLAEVQQVDGYGSPREKLDVLRALARPKEFTPGLQLSYDLDLPLLTPAQVLAEKPRISYVAYQ